VPDHDRSRLLAGELGAWLDYRRATADKVRRAAPTVQALAERRAVMNPRLSLSWLRYLVTIGARHDPDGWRWKIDPSLRLGGFGPWQPAWSMQRLPGLAMPVLALLGLQQEEMGWGTVPDDVRPYLPPGARFVPLEKVGHFMHIEDPHGVADLVLEFLA
jgi:pimeloyl-ACP methyl ester carboxylesterase